MFPRAPAPGTDRISCRTFSVTEDCALTESGRKTKRLRATISVRGNFTFRIKMKLALYWQDFFSGHVAHSLWAALPRMATLRGSSA
jgi:hypothetical protein